MLSVEVAAAVQQRGVPSTYCGVYAITPSITCDWPQPDKPLWWLKTGRSEVTANRPPDTANSKTQKTLL